jgi:hypothetical protein
MPVKWAIREISVAWSEAFAGSFTAGRRWAGTLKCGIERNEEMKLPLFVVKVFPKT